MIKIKEVMNCVCGKKFYAEDKKCECQGGKKFVPQKIEDADFIALVKEVNKIKELQKKLTDERSKLEGIVKDYIGDDEKLEVNGKELATYKKVESMKFDSKLFKKENNSLYDEYTYKNESYRLTIKKIK